MMKMRKGWLALLGLLIGSIALAALSPEELVKQTSQRMLNALQQEKGTIKKDPQRVRKLVDEIVLPHFDFKLMTRLALGRFWRRASASQQAELVEQFRNLLIRTYQSSLAQYSDQTVRYLPFNGNPGSGDVTVKTEVEQKGAPAIPIDYSLRLEDGQWKVYDVTIDGVSLVINYRSSFASEVRRGGIDGLIGKLKARNQQVGG